MEEDQEEADNNGAGQSLFAGLISDNSWLKPTKKSSVKTIFRNSDESWCYFGRDLWSFRSFFVDVLLFSEYQRPGR